MPAAPIIGAVAAVAGAGVAVVGTVSSIKAQKKAANAQQDQFKYQRAMDNNRAARERVQAIRAARLSYGGAQQAAVNQGAQNSSASLGGLGSIASQLNSNLSFLDTNNRISDQATAAGARAAKYGAAAEVWGSVANFGMQVFDAAGGVDAIKKGF
jgi:hypothetical protein